MRRSLGAAARSSSRYFSVILPDKLSIPVTVSPGRARLTARPVASGSPPITTTGVLGAALVAARAVGIATAIRTPGRLSASSAASARQAVCQCFA